MSAHFMVDMGDGTDIRDATPEERAAICGFWIRELQKALQADVNGFWPDAVIVVARTLLDRSEAHENATRGRHGYGPARAYLDAAMAGLVDVGESELDRVTFVRHGRAYAAALAAVEDAGGPAWFAAVVAVHAWETEIGSCFTWDDPAVVEAIHTLAAASAESLGWPCFTPR
jgi:hypothetical protein